MSEASGSVLDHLHVTALLSKLYNGEAMFTKSGANLRRKFVDPKDDRNSDTLVGAPHPLLPASSEQTLVNNLNFETTV